MFLNRQHDGIDDYRKMAWLLRIVVYSPFLRGRCIMLTAHNKYINTVLITGKRTEVDVCPPLLDLTHFQSAFILAIKHRP